MSADVDEFLSGYSAEIFEVAQQLRRLIMAVVPECSETLHTGWKVIAYRNGKAFCAIAPHKNWVNLQFHSGAMLEDPDELLTGTGKLMRHVKIVAGQFDEASVGQLVSQAAAQAAK